jgi:hypothetical protein
MTVALPRAGAATNGSHGRSPAVAQPSLLNTSTPPLHGLVAYSVSADSLNPAPTGNQQLLPNSPPISSLAFADLIGDNHQDAFQSTSHGWKVYDAANGKWVKISSDTTPLASLRFGHFSGPGHKSDVLRATGTGWQLSREGRGPWKPLTTSKVSAANLAVGDFDGNGTDDLFYGNGTTWFVSWGARTGWRPVKTSAYTTSQLVFGDFNGDGTTDVLAANGTVWKVAYSHKDRSAWTDWRPLRNNAKTLDKIASGDFNRDGLTDVLICTGQDWYLSFSATSASRHLFSSTVLRKDIAVANVIGDPGPDIITFVP